MLTKVRPGNRKMAIAMAVAGVKQADIALLTGITPHRISRIFRGRAKATEIEKAAIAEVLAVSQDALFKEPAADGTR